MRKQGNRVNYATGARREILQPRRWLLLFPPWTGTGILNFLNVARCDRQRTIRYFVVVDEEMSIVIKLMQHCFFTTKNALIGD